MPLPFEADHNLITDLTVGQLIAMVGTIIAIIVIIRKVNPVMHRLNDLLDDWFGQKQRPGVPERKGVMQRLSDQDDAIEQVKKGLSDQDEVLSHLRKKVEPLVDSTAAGNHTEVLTKLDEISGTTHGNTARLSRVEKLLHRHIRESKHWVNEVDRAAREKDFEVPRWPDLPEDED